MDVLLISIATLLIYFIVMIYAGNKFTKLIHRSETTYQKSVYEIPFEAENKTLKFGEVDLNIMFGFFNKTFYPVTES